MSKFFRAEWKETLLSQQIYVGGSSHVARVVVDVLRGMWIPENGDRQRWSEFDLLERTDGGRMEGRVG